MTDLSTLLHAAARGARIQALDRNLGWILSSHAPLELSNDKRPYRVHPSDEHLLWGPLSRQYYEAALFGDAGKKADEVNTNLLHFVSMHSNDWFAHYAEADEPTRRMILLTIALALRDEGM